jgi:predicted ester cyclase
MGSNADVVRRWFRDVWVDGGEVVIDELMVPEAAGVMEGFTIANRDGFKAARRAFLDLFPDLALTLDDVIEEGDKVVVRWSAEGTHRGDGFGFPATNRRVAFRGMTWVELRGGRLVRGWDSWNLGGVIATLQQKAAVVGG